MTSKKVLTSLVALFAAAALCGCTTPVKKDYTAFRSADPRSILILPVVNNTVDVNAPDYFLSTLSVPVAERGYYVFPINMVKRILEDDGLADAALVHNAEVSRLCNIFGPDSVLYVMIERWDAQYLVLSTQVTVAFDYKLKDCKTGQTLWAEKKAMVYSPQQSQSGGHPLGQLISMAISAAVTKAMPNYMPLARRANAEVFQYPGPGVPAGPYHNGYKKDMEKN